MVVSQSLLNQEFLALIGSTTVTAIYFIILVTVGSYIRSVLLVNAPDVLLYSELPDCDDILDLIYGIYIVRAARYVGHLRDEIRLFETLVKVIRSPEAMLRLTGENVINLPKDRVGMWREEHTIKKDT